MDPGLFTPLVAQGGLAAVSGILLFMLRVESTDKRELTNQLILTLKENAESNRVLAAALAQRAETERELAHAIRGVTVVQGGR